MITVDGRALKDLVPDATDLLENALRQGLDPAADPARLVTGVPAGQLLLMPGSHRGYSGVKIAGVAPGNPARGLPRIQASYLLLDGPTLTPLALIDGVALTSLRTPAVSAVAVRRLAVPDARRLVVFGSGPQALGHVEAIAADRPVTVVDVVARSRAEDFARELCGRGFAARTTGPEAVRDADLVVCATTAREPLFDGRDVAAHAVVVAVGSHEPDAREVDTALVARSSVIVEDRATALREAGDLIVPIRAGALPPTHVAADLPELVTGWFTPPQGRPRLFKSVGMAWEDLVIAAAAYERSPSA